MRRATSLAQGLAFCAFAVGLPLQVGCRTAPPSDGEPASGEPQAADLRPESAGTGARPEGADTSSRLIGTRWQSFALESEPAEWIFGPTLVTAVFHDRTSMTQIADWSGTDPRCLGVPNCVMLLDLQGVAFPLWFSQESNQLVRIECVDWELTGSGTPPTDEALLENSNFFVKYRRPDVFCGHGQTSPLYTPLTERSILVSHPDIPLEPQELPNGGLIVPTSASSRFTGAVDPSQTGATAPAPTVPPPLPPNSTVPGSSVGVDGASHPTPPPPPDFVPGGEPVVLPPAPPGPGSDVPPPPEFNRVGDAGSVQPTEPTVPRPVPPR